MKSKHLYVVKSTQPPTVEVDTEAGAAYIRFAIGKVARTVVQDQDGILVTFDLDERGEVLGAELVGVEEFTLESLVRNMPRVQHIPTKNARYVNARTLEHA